MKHWTCIEHWTNRLNAKSKSFQGRTRWIFTIRFLHVTTLNNCRANYAKVVGQPIRASVQIQDRFTSSVWNFWRWIADVYLRFSQVVAGANERRLYSQAMWVWDKKIHSLCPKSCLHHSSHAVNKGSRDGAEVRALASHQCVPGSLIGPGVMWVEFVVGSRPCPEGFSLGSSSF